MKKHFVFLLTFFLIAFSTVVYADDVNGVGEVFADKLNVRREPDMNADIIGALYDGDGIDIITKTNRTWYKIDYKGEIGFVYADYVEASRNAVVKIGVKTQSAEGKVKAQKAVEIAKEYLGVNYVWGGASPYGFDCSGLVYYVYGQLDIKLYRVAADQAKNGVEVNTDYLAAGDLVFFWNKESYSEINHVGIYVGDGMFIHAPSTGDVVKISSLTEGYYKKNFYKARRIFE